MSNSVTLTRRELAEKVNAVFPGTATRVIATESGYARISVGRRQALKWETLTGLSTALNGALKRQDTVVSVVELSPGRFAVEAIRNVRSPVNTRRIYLYDDHRKHITEPYAPKKDLLRDVPMQSLGPNRVALLTATDVVVIDLSAEPRALYFSETSEFEESALMSGMALYWLGPHPENPDTMLIACTDGYESAIEVYRLVGHDQIELADRVELNDRAVESAWFAPEGGYLGWTCVETNQKLREPADPSRLLIAGSVGLVTGNRELLSVDIPTEVFYGGRAYADAEIDFYRTCTTWLGRRSYVFRTAVGQLALCDLDDGKVAVVEAGDVERVKSLFRLGGRCFALMESGAMYQIASTPAKRRARSPGASRRESMPPPGELRKMNKQVKLANDIIDKAISERQKALNIGEYVTRHVPPRVFEMTWLTDLRLNAMSLTELPSEIGNLTELEELAINGNVKLESLPPSLGNLAKLKHLNAYWTDLRSLPDELGELASLSDLRLEKTALVEFPACIRRMRSLSSLSIGSPHIRSAPEWLSALPDLRHLSFCECPLTEVPNCVRQMERLESLALNRCPVEELPEWLSELKCLKILVLDETKIKVVPDWVWNSQTLECVGIDGLPDPPGFPVEKRRFMINRIKVTKFF